MQLLFVLGQREIKENNEEILKSIIRNAGKKIIMEAGENLNRISQHRSLRTVNNRPCFIGKISYSIM